MIRTAILHSNMKKTFLYGMSLLFLSLLLTILPSLTSHADDFSGIPGGTFASGMSNSVSHGNGGGGNMGGGGGGGGGSWTPPINLHSSVYIRGNIKDILSGKLTCGAGPNPKFPDAIGAIGASYFMFSDGTPAPASQVKQDGPHYWVDGDSRSVHTQWKYSCVYVQAGYDPPSYYNSNLSAWASCHDSPYDVWFSAAYSRSSNKGEIANGGYGIEVVNQRGPNLPEAYYNKWDLNSISCNTSTSRYSVTADANLSGQPYGYYRIDLHYKLKNIDVQIYTYDTAYTNGAIKINEDRSSVRQRSEDRVDHSWGSYTCSNGDNPARTFGKNDYGSLQANITTDPKDCQQNNWQCKIERGTTGVNNTNPAIARGIDLINSNGVMRDGSKVEFNQPSVNFYTYSGNVQNTGDDVKRYVIDVADNSSPYNKGVDKNNAKQYFKLLKANADGSYSQSNFGDVHTFPNRDQAAYRLQFFWASDPGGIWQSTFKAWIPSNTAQFSVPVVSDSSGNGNHREMWNNIGQIDCIQYGDPKPGGDPNKHTTLVYSNPTEVLRSVNSEKN